MTRRPHHWQGRPDFKAPRRRHRRQSRSIKLRTMLLAGGFMLAVISQAWPSAGPRFGLIGSSDLQSEPREGSRYFPNCASARAAGAAPLHAGEEGYREELDRDSDGVACEPYRY